MVKQRALISSLLLHMILIAALLVHFNPARVGDHTPKIVMAYLYHSNAIKNNNQLTHTTKPLTKKSAPKKQSKALIKMYYTAAKQTRIISQQIFKQQLSPGLHSQLLEALHDAIEKNQIYPEQASQLGLTGSVTLSFILHPNGNISNAQIVHPTRYTILNQSALATLQKVTPFNAEKYHLKLPTILIITIKFH